MTAYSAERAMAEALELLSDPRRVRVLSVLDERPDDELPLDEVVARVLELEEATGERRADRRSIAISLVHVHLPKLEAAGIVEHRFREGTVRLRGAGIGVDRPSEDRRGGEPDRGR